MKKLKVTIVALQDLLEDEVEQMEYALSIKKDEMITELQNEMKQTIGSDNVKIEVELIEE